MCTFVCVYMCVWVRGGWIGGFVGGVHNYFFFLKATLFLDLFHYYLDTLAQESHEGTEHYSDDHLAEVLTKVIITNLGKH